ncbi:MAG: SWIM zinc finger family protein [Candidatus Riflebacteria bacterium]|nr:SWIM zinc finger family protein [Candidatus Riflebacteria bacterium]
MMERPRIDPGVLGALSKAVPQRIARRLDADPKVAGSWLWARDGEAWSVTTDGGETVRITSTGEVVRSADQIRCTCLLGPRCLHVLAVASSLDLDAAGSALAAPGGAPATARGVDGPAGPPLETAVGAPPQRSEVSPSQREAAEQAWHTAGRVLGAGAHSAGTVLQGELLRCVHAARAEGLHRLGASGLRVVRRLRELREGAAAFDAAELQSDLLDLLVTARALGGEPIVDRGWIGVARRIYEPVGSLRASGIFCEPVVSAAGHGGVVTWLIGGDDRLVTLPDVMPGDVHRARGAYVAGVALGGSSLTHRELCRAGLFLSGATASADGRLGSGKGVDAVRSEGMGWAHPALGRRFLDPWPEQNERVDRILEEPADTRAAGAALLMARLKVAGVCERGLVAEVVDQAEAAWIVLAPALVHPELAFVDNLRRLSIRGLGLRAIMRRPERGRTLSLLAISADEASPGDSPRLELPAAWKGICNVGYDRLQVAHVLGGLPAPEIDLPLAPDPLSLLSRWLTRVVLGGRGALPHAALAGIQRDAQRLGRMMMPGAASCLASLGAAAGSGQDALSRAWVASAIYERAARRKI